MIKHNLNHLPSAALLVTTKDIDGNYDSITVLAPWEFTRGDVSDRGHLTNFGHLSIVCAWGKTSKILQPHSSSLFTGKPCLQEELLVTSREMALNTYLELVKQTARPTTKYVKIKLAA